MSKARITQYYNEVDQVTQFAGSYNEGTISPFFANLLNHYCQTRDFILAQQLEFKTKSGKSVRPDGTIKDALRLDWGFWESKDEDDNLDREIAKKLAKGYPDDNILFEDSKTAVLIQKGRETMRVNIREPDNFDRILTAFINYVRPEVKDFREAIEQFKNDLPTILESLRKTIAYQAENNPQFQEASTKFLSICQEAISPEVTLFDVQEMAIQHILTEDIFLSIFSESQFHKENNIARELQGLIDTFFTGKTKRETLGTIERYYAVIRRNAANIYSHQEKQKFLKAVYENFYKAYNPKAADRLGIVYTPNEIVKFMIESVDYLLEKHFKKSLADEGVKILDPATGTGTFITELIEYLPKNKLKDKYQKEIHCNELAILPYYIANLNIEYTYQQKMKEYEEFKNICLVDTLDHTSFEGKQYNLFAMSVENTARIQRQNECKISVIIGNPPYNANQQNENDNNKNRDYQAIDKKIKETYIKESTAQKTKVYDMYSRFFRWATDKISNGIICFITNSSFLDARSFDGFRKCIQDEFYFAYIIDLGGNVRAISGKDGIFISEKHTIFGLSAMIGIAIIFLVKDARLKENKCQIFYVNPFHIHELRDRKIEFLATNKFQDIDFNKVTPDAKNNWINLTDNDFYQLIPVCSKNKDEGSIFQLNTLGVSTNRDEWIYDLSAKNLQDKVVFFMEKYNEFLAENDNSWSSVIKWSRDLKKKFAQKKVIAFDEKLLILANYRPYVKQFWYAEKVLNDILTQNHYDIFGTQLRHKNLVICLRNVTSSKDFCLLAICEIADLHFVGDTVCLSLYRYDENGARIDNITDWGLTQFRDNYDDKKITKLDIFHYTYAVLHHPIYREKYEQNLKRDFPRIPFYDNFQQWVKWGKKLMELHINYETVKPYQLKRIDVDKPGFSEKPGLSDVVKTKLKADRDQGEIILDDLTTLTGIPAVAWEYKLGNRSALEWILDQYKEKKPKDPTIAAQFNTYKFADYKETVIDLLQRVCTVSVETMKIIKAMDQDL